MKQEDVYELWRPPDSPWSPWVKPVLFAFMNDGECQPNPQPHRAWRIPFRADTAIIVSLPGIEGVSLGLAGVASGYRPVPVYNACPYALLAMETGLPPSIVAQPTRVPADTPVIVDVAPIVVALQQLAPELSAAKLPVSVPPIFLLDSNRAGPGGTPPPGWFDNRSFASPSDFPSSAFFAQHGIAKIVLIHSGGKIPADLSAVLLALQDGGLTIAAQTPWETWDPKPKVMNRPARVLDLWNRLKWALGYRRNVDGYFGRVVPHHSG